MKRELRRRRKLRRKKDEGQRIADCGMWNAEWGKKIRKEEG
jgi:hypothetical protein